MTCSIANAIVVKIAFTCIFKCLSESVLHSAGKTVGLRVLSLPLTACRPGTAVALPRPNDIIDWTNLHDSTVLPSPSHK